VDHIKAGWETVQPNLVGWIIYTVVFGVVVSVTFGLGAILGINFVRGAKAAVDSGGAPEIGALFNFDNIVQDIITMVIVGVANSIGSALAGIGALITGTALFWAPMLVADGQAEAVDACKASVAHAKANFMEILVFLLIASVLNMAGAIACGLGMIVTAPVTVAAGILYYNSSKEEIRSLATADGVTLIG